jgi:hypothetical protein
MALEYQTRTAWLGIEKRRSPATAGAFSLALSVAPDEVVHRIAGDANIPSAADRANAIGSEKFPDCRLARPQKHCDFANFCECGKVIIPGRGG